MSFRFRFLDHDGPIAFAHRGGGAEKPENTWAAFSHAYEIGYRYMESDVHASADGVAVLIHDPVLDRVADRPGRVGDFTWAELRQVRLAGGEGIPRLDEALAAWPDVRWNLDAKADPSVPVLVEAIQRAGATTRVCVTSFSDRRVASVQRALGPELCSAMGPNAVALMRMASLLPAMPLGRFAAFGAIQVPLRWGAVPVVDRRLVAAAHRGGLAVHVWTIDERRVMEDLLDLGVDGIMTDSPTVLGGVLADRGAWRPQQPPPG